MIGKQQYCLAYHQLILLYQLGRNEKVERLFLQRRGGHLQQDIQAKSPKTN